MSRARGALVVLAVTGALVGATGARLRAEPTPALTAPASSAPAPVIPADTPELITGVIDGFDATEVTLRRFRRHDGAWRPVGDAWRGVIGRGAAWGRGLHGPGAPAGADGPIKREGDGRSPAGVFALRGSYGVAARPPRGTQLPYTSVTASWQCVDDPGSRAYTKIVNRATAAVDWKSAEAMKRRDALYTWVIDIAHNADAAPGAGSCIFFHVWRSAEEPTVGCTAMPARAITALLASLDPRAVYVLLPRAAYDAFAAPWGLPPREK